MIKSLIYSITFHSVLVLLTILSLPFMLREPIDLPPIVSVELIQISFSDLLQPQNHLRNRLGRPSRASWTIKPFHATATSPIKFA